jgi:3-oxoadipate enol-lactonase
MLDGRFWFEMPELLANDPEQPWHVLVPDNRGVGLSDLPRRPWTMADMADDVAAVLDAVAVRQAVVAGISMGGMIAQHLALRHPERVAGLVLMATTPGLPYGKLPDFDMLRNLVGSSLTQRRDLDTLARLVLPEREVPNAWQYLEGWVGLMRDQPPRRRTFLGQFGAVATHSTRHRLGRIHVPVRVVTGDEDRLVPARNSELLAARLPNAELEILSGVGHGIPFLDRDVVRRNAGLLRPG